jgi:phenylacetate-coenzyme A ligase PaaK-like adenylate-forming protein
MTVRTESNLEQAQKTAREKLDAWVREIVAWHFDPATGTPFWLDRAKSLGFDPRREIQNYDDLDRFGFFEDEWLRGGPVRRWVPKAYSDRPVYTFETGGSTGVPKSRISIEDFRIDYELFSETLPDDAFPKARTGSL